jgi:aryl-alcohol dehydrogenase-like predicted oxidoreductase
MHFRVLGRTGLRVSAVAFGAGPVSGLMTGDDFVAQESTLRRAVELGINWIDTAPGYGQGASETNIGRAMAAIGARDALHIATKVRLGPDQLCNIRDAIRRSVDASLQRLRVPAVTLLQLHNGLTLRRDDEPFSITPADVLGRRGVLDAFRELQGAGLVRYFGLTGTGEPLSMSEVVHSAGFDTIQVPYNIFNATAGYPVMPEDGDTDYGNIIADCVSMNMGVFAIRVFAGGAILGHEPSAHTLKTPFFPLALYQRDRERADELVAIRGSLKESALRFVIDDARVHSAIVGFGSADQVEEVAGMVDRA